MKNNAKVGGILSIVAGGWSILYMFGLILFAIILLVMRRFDNGYYGGGPRQEWFFVIIAVIYFIWGICCGLLGALAIVGGVLALRKRHWGWALAGSIASAITFFPCGVPAVIFTAMGKPEFDGKATPDAPAAPMEKIVG